MRNAVLISAAVLLGASAVRAQQVADTSFSPRVSAPAYKGGGPLVLIDEAHYNFHTAEGRYLPFARLVARDGYTVRPGKSKFSAASLAGTKVLVIANALAERNQTDWDLPTPSAFDSSEIAAVHDWVQGGGSLLLIADHMPFPGAAGQLAATFGILMVNGFALDAATEQDGQVAYRRADGSLADHPITRGRNAAERIDSIVAFTGQAFRVVGGGVPLMALGKGEVLLLPQSAWQFSTLTPRMSGEAMLQGAAVQVGKGRVAVFGEAAMFSAQLSGPDHEPTGMNAPIAPQNAQFLLNVMHWLTGLL